MRNEARVLEPTRAPSRVETVEVRRTTLTGVLVLEPPTVFEDFRGTYVETQSEGTNRIKGGQVRIN